MKAVLNITGVAAALAMSNIDTDVIIRIEHLAQGPREKLGDWCFGPLRYWPDGSQARDFIFNKEGWRRAPILVTGANFGCGSSREHAVWALQGMGIACVIAPSFGDIFRSNCFQNGLLALTLDTGDIQVLTEFLMTCQQRGEPVSLSVDLADQRISWPGGADFTFSIEARRRTALLEGLDPIGTTLKLQEKISAWQDADRENRPWIWQAAPT